MNASQCLIKMGRDEKKSPFEGQTFTHIESAVNDNAELNQRQCEVVEVVVRNFAKQVQNRPEFWQFVIAVATYINSCK